MYQANLLDIKPSFQRLYRWNSLQKSKFIESLLLGYPIPPMFVSVTESGGWEVFDGVQRLSTILHFMEALRDHDESLSLESTELLPSLHTLRWKPSSNSSSFSTDQQIDFLGIKLLFVVIHQKAADSNEKLELFIRMNTLGSRLSDQEIRNVVIHSISPGFAKKIEELSEYQPFIESISISEDAKNMKDHQDLLLRFFMMSRGLHEKYAEITELNYIITACSRELAEKFRQDGSMWDEFERIFTGVFSLLNEAFDGEGSFKRTKNKKDGVSFVGPMQIGGFEGIATGVALNLPEWQAINRPEALTLIKERSIAFWEQASKISSRGAGGNFKQRLPAMIDIGRQIMKP